MESSSLEQLTERLGSLETNPLIYPPTDPTPYFDAVAPLIRGLLDSMALPVPPDLKRPPPSDMGRLLAPPPEHPSSSMQEVVETAISAHQAGITPCHPMNMAFFPSHNGLDSLLGQIIAHVWLSYAPVRYLCPGTLALEEGLIQWMCGLFHLPGETAHGTLLTGGAMSQLHATICGREHGRSKGARLDQMRLYTSTQAHQIVGRSAFFAGLPREAVREVEVDHEGKMDMSDLETKVRADVEAGLVPTMLVVTAGTTPRGAIDDLGAAAAIAKRYDMWYHVDACYGGFYMLVPAVQPLFAGIELADSISADPHKTLFVPWGSGALLFRDMARAARYLTSQDISYLRLAERGTHMPDPFDFTIEVSREPRALKLWVPLQLYGVGVYREALASRLELATYLERRLDQIPELMRLPAQLAVVLVYLQDKERNAKWIKCLLDRPDVLLMRVEVGGRPCLRITTCQARARIGDVDRVVAMMQEALRHA